MKKYCKKCSTFKNESDFRPNKRRKSGLQPYCEICDKNFQKEWYRNNRERTKAKSIFNNTKNRNRNLQYVLNYFMEHPCAVCGETDLRVLEFDHIKPGKIKSVAKLMSGSLLIIINEIKKCQVLCANCHRKKTSDDFKWYKSVKI